MRLETHYGKKTSSVSDEIAEELFEGVLYTVSLALRASPDADAALGLLMQTPTEHLYLQGLRYCRILLRDVRVLCDSLQREETPAFRPFYSSAIRRELPAFLRRYAPDVRAHVHDFYPVYATAGAKNTLSGVEHVRAYAMQLLAETRFCNLFDTQDLTRVLSSPRSCIENAFEAVLTHACVGVLALGTVTLHVSDDDMRFVRETFDASAAENELRKAFAGAPFVQSALGRVARALTKPSAR